MSFVFKEITEAEYQELNCRAIIEEDSRFFCSFAKIETVHDCYKLCWVSELVSPEIIEVGKGVLAIGIDFDFVVIDLNDNVEKLHLDFPCYFCCTIKNDDFLIVVSQTEIFVVNSQYDVSAKIDLPDICEDVKLVDGMLNIRCMDGFCLEYLLKNKS